MFGAKFGWTVWPFLSRNPTFFMCDALKLSGSLPELSLEHCHSHWLWGRPSLTKSVKILISEKLHLWKWVAVLKGPHVRNPMSTLVSLPCWRERASVVTPLQHILCHVIDPGKICKRSWTWAPDTDRTAWQKSWQNFVVIFHVLPAELAPFLTVFVMIGFVMFLSCVHGGSLAHFVVRGFQFCHAPWSGLESPSLLDRNAWGLGPPSHVFVRPIPCTSHAAESLEATAKHHFLKKIALFLSWFASGDLRRQPFFVMQQYESFLPSNLHPREGNPVKHRWLVWQLIRQWITDLEPPSNYFRQFLTSRACALFQSSELPTSCLPTGFGSGNCLGCSLPTLAQK